MSVREVRASYVMGCRVKAGNDKRGGSAGAPASAEQLLEQESMLSGHSREEICAILDKVSFIADSPGRGETLLQ